MFSVLSLSKTNDVIVEVFWVVAAAFDVFVDGK